MSMFLTDSIDGQTTVLVGRFKLTVMDVPSEFTVQGFATLAKVKMVKVSDLEDKEVIYMPGCNLEL